MFSHTRKRDFFSKPYFFSFVLILVFHTFFSSISADPDKNSKTEENKPSQDSSGISQESKNPWETHDISPEFPELKILEDVGGKKSMEYFKTAENYYNESNKILDETPGKVRDKKEELTLDKIQRFQWERIDQEERIKKIEKKITHENQLKALNLDIRSIEYLEKVKNPALRESEMFADLQAKTTRLYIKLQFQNNNCTQTISAMQRYFALSKAHQNEAPAHKILAICYGRESALAEKSGDIATRDRFDQKKNEHMLKYAEISYGKDSQEYKYLSKYLYIRQPE